MSLLDYSKKEIERKQMNILLKQPMAELASNVDRIIAEFVLRKKAEKNLETLDSN